MTCKPFVLETLLGTGSVMRIRCCHLDQEGYPLWRNALQIILSHNIYHVGGVCIFILSQNLQCSDSSEQTKAREHVEKQDAQAEDVNFRRSLLLSKDLRCYIARRATLDFQFNFIAEPARHA